ncbi:lysophospholipase 1 [Diutina catenulata]
MNPLLLLWAMALVAATGYAPDEVQCPATNLLREGNDISDSEKKWLEARRKKVKPALEKYAQKVGLDDDLSQLDDVVVGVALSGGGYRAMLVGGGALAALDSRTDGAPLGGVLDSATYVSALSGGSWALGSLLANDWAPVSQVKDSWNVTHKNGLISPKADWVDLAYNVLFPDLDGALEAGLNHYSSIKNQTDAKKKAGFGISVTDFWGRGLAHQMMPAEGNYGESRTISDIRDSSVFSDADMPFPLVVALGRRPGTLTYNLNSTVVEMNPFEIGSFDTSLNSFSDIKYLGTKVSNGRPDANDSCINGFDNLGFVVGTSSSLFNQYLNGLVCDDCHQLNWFLKFFAKRFLTYLSNNYDDVAEYRPNPFFGSEYARSENITKNETLYLIDGGIGGEVIPLSSIMTKERKLDVAFAFDNGNDLDNNFPSGGSLVSTYERQFGDQGKSTVCPYVPSVDTFLHSNFTAQPVFFGCDAKNLTELEKDGVVPPLVVYMANRPFDLMSNTSLYTLTYKDSERDLMVKNGWNVASRANTTLDSDWPKCIACAMIRRSQERQDIEQSDECKKCFDKYCWDGSVYEGNYSAPVNFTTTGLTNDPMMSMLNEPSVLKRLLARANAASGYQASLAMVVGVVAAVVACVN